MHPKRVGDRLHGVIDGSIIPDMVGGNINAPIIAMAERMSDILRGKPTLTPAEV